MMMMDWTRRGQTRPPESCTGICSCTANHYRYASRRTAQMCDHEAEFSCVTSMCIAVQFELMLRINAARSTTRPLGPPSPRLACDQRQHTTHLAPGTKWGRARRTRAANAAGGGRREREDRGNRCYAGRSLRPVQPCCLSPFACWPGETPAYTSAGGALVAHGLHLCFDIIIRPFAARSALHTLCPLYVPCFGTLHTAKATYSWVTDAAVDLTPI
jgi:hypothetical protein